jgi:hypothetical protein
VGEEGHDVPRPADMTVACALDGVEDFHECGLMMSRRGLKSRRSCAASF